MKQILLIITVIMMVITSCKESEPENRTTLFDFTPYYQAPLYLNGQVKSIQYRTYWAKEVDGKIEKGEIITRTERDSLNLRSDFNLIFNEAGIVTKTEYITYDGQINYRDLEIQDNRIVKATWNYYGEPINYITLIYDDLGNNIERYQYRIDVDTLMNKSNATFYENGNKKEVLLYNFNDELIGKREYIWNDSDLVTEYLTYNPSGELSSQMKPSYNENNIFFSVVYDSPDRGKRKYELKEMVFDDMGNLVSSIAYKNDKLFSVNEMHIEYY